MLDKKRTYTFWNGIYGDQSLYLFENEHHVEGIETNGDAIYDGDEGFEDLKEQCTSPVPSNKR